MGRILVCWLWDGEVKLFAGSLMGKRRDDHLGARSSA